MNSFVATVTSATRRYAEICDADFSFKLAKVASRSLDICPGDLVTCESQQTETMVTEATPRQNIISRSYRNKTKDIVSNVGHLFIVTAVGDLFNTVFVDRAFAVAHSQNIPTTIIVNKSDLQEESAHTKPTVDLYAKIGTDVIWTSAKAKLGIDELSQKITNLDVKNISMLGISGAGKSSLINSLLPNAAIRTQEVSARTGQGRQTTTQAFAYPFPESSPKILLFDTPGLQSFGINHLSESQIQAGFLEFQNLEKRCRFQDCRHLSEPECVIIEKVKQGLIANSRYKNYCAMIAEIDSDQPY